MRDAGEGAEGTRLRGIIVVLWRAGLRISEALAFNETDLDPNRGLAGRASRQGSQASGGRDGPLGLGAPCPRGWSFERSYRSAVLRRARPDGRASLCCCRNPRPTAPHRRDGRRPPAVRPAPAPTRSRSRDVARRDLPARHPETARACRPGDYVPISPRHRQQRDHRGRLRTTSADDPRRPADRSSRLRDCWG
jgi:hypothetical protein